MASTSTGPLGANAIWNTALFGNLVPKYRRARPTGPDAKPGQLLEVPFRFSARMLALSAAFSLAALWVDRKLFITTPESMTPEFQERASRIGPVVERVAASPVFSNPIRNRIPGNLRGPDDVAALP